MKLKELRIKHGYTQAEVAKKIGVSTSTYRNYENDIKAIGRAPVTKIAELSMLYKISADEIFKDYIASGQWEKDCLDKIIKRKSFSGGAKSNTRPH